MQHSRPLPSSLHDVLTDLHEHPYPHIPNPPSCKKRASVALILRVRPTYNHWPDPSSPPLRDNDSSVKQQLGDFFSEDWVEHGDPEVLFIKRASRVGDRWTGHIALPGGKRDPEDEDDKAAAIREASEEIGLDLKTEDCIHVGNLPERVVTTSWGTIPLQPTEVASTHWVPLRSLLSSTSRTLEHVNVSQRLASRGGFATGMAFRSLVGMMQFSAIRLQPTESLVCNSTPELVPEEGQIQRPISLFQRWKAWYLSNQVESTDQGRPLLLWGLTLGVLADFLDMLPPHTAVQLWQYPTFSPPDLRLIVSIVTHGLRKRNTLRVKSGARRPSNTALDSQTAAFPVTESARSSLDHNDVGIGGLGVGRYYGPSDKNPDGSTYAVGIMLRGYYDRLWVALYVFFAWRVAIGSTALFYAWKLFRDRLFS